MEKAETILTRNLARIPSFKDNYNSEEWQVFLQSMQEYHRQFKKKKILNDKRSVDEVKTVCEHDWVYKLMFDHTACNICTKCHKIEKQTG